MVALYVTDDLGELVGARQGRPDLLRQCPMGGVRAHRQRSPEPPQCVLDYYVVAIRGKQDADARAVTMLWAPQEIIDGIDVEAELAQVLGLDAADLEFEDHVAAQTEMKKQQV